MSFVTNVSVFLSFFCLSVSSNLSERLHPLSAGPLGGEEPNLEQIRPQRR